MSSMAWVLQKLPSDPEAGSDTQFPEIVAKNRKTPAVFLKELIVNLLLGVNRSVPDYFIHPMKWQRVRCPVARKVRQLKRARRTSGNPLKP
jgi:hypothetical protein